MVKSTNEILSEILSIITSGLPLPDIKVQLEDIINNQNLSKNLQEQILQYINKISEDSDTGVDLLRTFIQLFSAYNIDMHSFYQDWLCNNIYVKETLSDIKTNQIINNEYASRLNHLTSDIKDDTAYMTNLMTTQNEIMMLMMKQELSNTHNIEILADLSGQTLYSIDRLVNKVDSINDNIQKMSENVESINGKMPEPGPLPPGPVPPGPGPKPPVPPVPPVPPKPKPPVPPVPPKPEFLFYCQHCNRMVLQCPKTKRKCCSCYETKNFPVYAAETIIKEREFNKWLNEKLNEKLNF